MKKFVLCVIICFVSFLVVTFKLVLNMFHLSLHNDILRSHHYVVRIVVCVCV